ncbi:regulatory protein RecX [Planctobacterium marinum]|uniref:Regulatory protein RecX n=1 Tax=Planctobacterium marinum TaxID=1631968 RepID=A0AA48HI49_9ALTE|nr:regulatory protein RecX [Planctobacterium marinum]
MLIDDSPDKQLSQIREAAIRLLARREHSQQELLRKLLQKGFAAQLCETALADLQAQGYQSDLRFAQMFIRSRAAKFYGPGRITDELRQHQVVSSDSQKAMQEADIDWFELCKDALLRKFRSGTSDDWQVRQKQKRYLWQRGFSEDQIQYALNPD